MPGSVPTPNDYEALIKDFRALPGRVERPRTFMEIAGYPHYENVCSNILAFFMDPEEPHGLGTLVLDALAGASNIAADGGLWGNVSVEREVVTRVGNRVDILVTTDDHAVLIENKILAAVHNPFPDYSRFLDGLARGRRKHKLLLTLSSSGEGSRWGFVNLTHAEFVTQVRSKLGHYVSGADARHLTMFLDFLNTLENLQKGTRMNKEFVTFLAERGDEIEDFDAVLKQFRIELEEKAKSLRSLVDASHSSVGGREGVGPWSTLSCSLHHLIDIPDDPPFRASIRTIIGPRGWDIEFHTGLKRDHPGLRDLLQRLEIPYGEKQGGQGFRHPARFAYDANPADIGPVLQGLIDKLATGGIEPG